MKKYVLITTGCVAIIAIVLFIGLRNTSDLQPHMSDEQTNSVTSPEPVRSDSDTTSTSTVDSEEVNKKVSDKKKTIPDDTEVSNKKEGFDWLSNDQQDNKDNGRDPFTEHLLVEQAKTEGIWIQGDLREMSPEEQRNAIHKHLLERFGDIPEVHAMTKFQRKKDEKIQMTLEEQLEGHKAIYHLFPSERNRKSVAFLEWARSKGSTHKGLEKITPTDIKHLRNHGITVETKNIGDGGGSIKISTK